MTGILAEDSNCWGKIQKFNLPHSDKTEYSTKYPNRVFSTLLTDEARHDGQL
jgi:hypothetical protein